MNPVSHPLIKPMTVNHYEIRINISSIQTCLINQHLSHPFLPHTKDNLQHGANARDEEDGADEVTLRQAVML